VGLWPCVAHAGDSGLGRGRSHGDGPMIVVVVVAAT